MKPILIVGFAILIASVLVQATSSAATSCGAGEARAFASIRQEPPYLVGTIPSKFTGQARYFQRRYNCRNASAEVRRVDLGVYDVRFRKLIPRAVIVTALSDAGVTTSAFPLGNDTVRVVLRGPLGGERIASHRDVPFTVVVY